MLNKKYKTTLNKTFVFKKKTDGSKDMFGDPAKEVTRELPKDTIVTVVEFGAGGRGIVAEKIATLDTGENIYGDSLREVGLKETVTQINDGIKSGSLLTTKNIIIAIIILSITFYLLKKYKII